MKAWFAFALSLSMLFCRVAQADTSPGFVRIACVPEAGLLDIEYRTLHDSVSRDPNGEQARGELLARAGFHDPHQLKFSCVLGGATYNIAANQDPTSERMCGGSPEVYVTVTRDGQPLLSNVIFGESCNQLPSVIRLTVGDGPKSWRSRETQVCYATGKESDPFFAIGLSVSHPNSTCVSRSTKNALKRSLHAKSADNHGADRYFFEIVTSLNPPWFGAD